MNNRNTPSDEGYQSDPGRPKTRDFTTEELKLFARENKAFREKYFIEEVLTNSANGVIYKGYRASDHYKVVAKQIPKAKVFEWGAIGDRVVPTEIEMHFKASSVDGVVKVLDWYERKTSFVLVMQRPSNSCDLFDVSSKLGALAEDPTKIIFSNIVNSVISLHRAGLVHRDIKDENILVDLETLETNIIDFGCATKTTDAPMTQLTGTPEFFAPEMYTTGSYKAEETAVWSLGTLLYCLLVGQIPFQTDKQIVRLETCQPELEKNLSEDAKDLLKSLLQLNPARRPKLKEILDHPWFFNFA
ncbi:Oidioi.mRNA.OKI2018_I69.chr1.g3244.t1.cds [Oikopleura dioica]|uniref:Serine/threonine-protein kinase pim-1 n=1 Tax=Oikopleura dioica TaxID=34765 RepID=A0ABN7SU61_OIKDI|nr:Oidioi.mRNA.OKI2018_I69.chr1.g3244.t1.cds [Oikopleura dioica]